MFLVLPLFLARRGKENALSRRVERRSRSSDLIQVDVSGSQKTLLAPARTFRKGGRYGWKPSSSSNLSVQVVRAQIVQFELLELILLVKLDKRIPVVQFEASRAIRADSTAVSSTLPPLSFEFLSGGMGRVRKRPDPERLRLADRELIPFMVNGSLCDCAISPLCYYYKGFLVVERISL